MKGRRHSRALCQSHQQNGYHHQHGHHHQQVPHLQVNFMAKCGPSKRVCQFCAILAREWVFTASVSGRQKTLQVKRHLALAGRYLGATIARCCNHHRHPQWRTNRSATTRKRKTTGCLTHPMGFGGYRAIAITFSWTNARHTCASRLWTGSKHPVSRNITPDQLDAIIHDVNFNMLLWREIG